MDNNELVICQGLTKNYGKKTALNNLNLTLGRGQFIGLLGPNGSGKTTTIKLLNGLLQPTSGSVLIDGQAPGTYTHSIISYLPDKNYLNDAMKVNDLISFFADFYTDFDRVKATDMLDSLGIDPLNRLKTLSKGNQEKVQLILTMSRKAQLYVLDEPIAGVDPAARDYILSTILSNYSEDCLRFCCPRILSRMWSACLTRLSSSRKVRWCCTTRLTISVRSTENRLTPCSGRCLHVKAAEI